MARTVKVAVIGSGLAGLTAAYRLAKTPRVDDVEFEVHLFEKASLLGMDSHSVNLSLSGADPHKSTKKTHRVDVPMRSFQGGYYNQLISLYKHLGVRFRQADFSYSFARFSTTAGTMQDVNLSNRKITTFAIYDGASGRKGISVPTAFYSSGPSSLWNSCVAYLNFACAAFILVVFSLRMAYLSLPIRASLVSPNSKLSPGHVSHTVQFDSTLWGLLSDPIRIHIPIHLLVIPIRPHPSMTFREWIDMKTPKSSFARWAGWDRLWRGYAQDVLVPLYSAVCTAPEEMVWDHPVEEFLDFMYLTIGTHHYVVENGVRDVVQRISAPVKPENIHLASPIVSLVHNSRSTIDICCTNNTTFSGFHHVVFATQANHAASLLKTYLDTIPNTPEASLERHIAVIQDALNCLCSFAYCQTVVINHTDSTLMPDAPRDRRDLNLTMADHPPASSTTGEQGLCMPPTYAMATHVLTQSCKSIKVFQTTNPIVSPAEDAVLSVTRLERAVVSVGGKEALGGLWQEHEHEKRYALKWGCAATQRGVLGRLQGAGRYGEPAQRTTGVPGIWFCGSYAHCGIPLLEGCVASGRNVVEQGIWPSEGVDVSRIPSLW